MASATLQAKQAIELVLAFRAEPRRAAPCIIFDKPNPMTTIVHLSDTHFGTEVQAVVQAAIAAIQALQPDLILLSGDVTQRARRHEFDAALDFFAALPAVPRLVIPGNHDLPLFNLLARALMPYRGFRCAFGACESSWQSAQVGVLGFNTTSPLRHKDGALDMAYLTQRVAAFRAELAADAVVIACIHQPLHTAWPRDQDQVIAHPRQLTQAFSAAGVDLVCSGHVHVPFIATTAAAFPTVARPLILSCAGTGLSRRVRFGAPNSFNVIEIVAGSGAREVRLRQFDFDVGNGVFAPQTGHRFLDQGGGWLEAGFEMSERLRG